MRSPIRARLAAVAATAGLILGGLGPSVVPVAAADPLILRVATDQKLETLNPWYSLTVADYEIFQLQYDMLVSFGQSLEPVPGFADRWEASADRMTHTFHIRDGMKWSDGEPATCEDARWTYQFVLDVVASEAGYVGSGYLEPYVMNAGLSEVSCTDPLNLVVTTEFPTTLLTQAYVPILPKHVWSQYTIEQIGNADAEGLVANDPPVVGSGPYTAVQWEPGQFIKFTRNDRYWGTRGVPDEIIFQQFADSDTMVQALKRGEIGYVRGTGADQFDALASDPDIKTSEGFSNGYTYLSFNTRGNQDGYSGSTSALADVAFRDALGFAIDRQKLVDAVLNGHGVPGTTHIPPYHVKWHVEPDRPRTFDLAEANKRLDAAGYARNAAGNREDAEGKEIVLRLTWPDSEDHSADAQFIQGWFADLGIGVDAYVTEEGKLYEDLAGPESGGIANWDFYIWGWTGDPDPMSLLSFFTTDQIAAAINDPFYSDPRYDELFGLQQRATDEAQRKAYIAEMQQLFYDAAAYHILYNDSELHAYRTDTFAGWINQPPDSGTPLFGYGYPGYLKLTSVAAAAQTGTLVVAVGVAVVVVVAVVGLILIRRRGRSAELEE
jgi:peptide/nickel transport system substrate-binding protein